MLNKIFYVFIVTLSFVDYKLNAMENNIEETPKIRGRVVEWLQNPREDLQLKVILNHVDKEARSENENKSQPIMLTDVKRIDKHDVGTFEHAILLESGSHIEFVIRARGPLGFGYKIYTDKEIIVEKLYQIHTEQHYNFTESYLRRYQNNARTIKVDNFSDLGIKDNEEKGKMMFCNIECFKIYNMVYNGTYYNAGRQLEHSVKANIKGGGVHQGSYSESKFNEGLSCINKDRNFLIDSGKLRIAFLVFANQEAKNKFYNSYQDIKIDESF